MKKEWIGAFVAGAVCFSAGAALSQAVTFPITLTSFTANTPAVANQVNANFSALKNATEYIKTQVEAKSGPLNNLGSIQKATTINGTATISSTLWVGGLTSLTSGATVSGPFNVTGSTSLDGNTIVSGNLTVSGEVRDTSRYTALLNWNSAYPSAANGITPIDMTRFRALCSDDDGCLVRMVMKRYKGGGGQDASIGPLHFQYDGTSGAMRSAEGPVGSAFFTGGNGTQVDGDGNLDHALQAWNCFLTDTSYQLGGNQIGSDSGNSLYLLNYSWADYQSGCQLIVDD